MESELIEKIITFIFVSEMVLKIIGLGPSNYAKNKLNLFDGIITSISVAQTILEITNMFKNVSKILKSTKVLRIIRLIRDLPVTKLLVETFNNSIVNFLNIFFLLSLFIFIFTLIGMNIFGGIVSNDER